jgi:hypothetical protein
MLALSKDPISLCLLARPLCPGSPGRLLRGVPGMDVGVPSVLETILFMKSSISSLRVLGS